jgi:hypothetical protein
VKPPHLCFAKLARRLIYSLFFFFVIIPGMICRRATLFAASQQSATALEITKIEPPNWWIGLTPEVLLLLTGHGLEATHVSCNLPSLRVTRTQASAGGGYLFVWLKFGPEMRSGTAVCRIKTAKGPASFELPLANRSDTTGKFQGLSSGELPYLIVPKPFLSANSSDDKSGAAHKPREKSAAGAHVMGDLPEIRGQLAELKNLGATALRLSPLAIPDSADESRGTADFYSMDPILGSLKDLQELVDSAHAQNMKVVLDLDPLHLGEHHPWVSKPPLAEWLGMSGNPRGNPAKPSDEPPNANPILDTENPLVALYILQNNIWWVETAGLDGIHVTRGPDATNSFWRSWRAGLQKIYPHLSIFIE